MIENTYIKNSKSWSEFSSKINLLIENNKKLQAGKIYEKCVQLFLQTDPKYQAALKHVWLLQDVPKSVREKLKLPNADEGIDLIAETNQKSYWAIQAKYKSDKTYINKGWENWSDFLGIKIVANQDKKFLNYSKIKQIIKNKNFKNRYEYRNYIKKNKLNDKMPLAPHLVFNNFKGWSDFLGKKYRLYFILASNMSIVYR